jgi:hypothetical protein
MSSQSHFFAFAGNGRIQFFIVEQLAVKVPQVTVVINISIRLKSNASRSKPAHGSSLINSD